MSRTEHEVDGIRVGDTPHGLGLFATREFSAEERVGAVGGQLFDDPDYQSDYCIDLDDGFSLEPGEPFCYLNHSCRPNCALYCSEPAEEDDNEDEAVCDDEPIVHPEVWVEALLPIQPGEQLTIDYAWPAEHAIPCACKAPNCRGWIVDEDQAHRLPPPSPPLTPSAE